MDESKILKYSTAMTDTFRYSTTHFCP